MPISADSLYRFEAQIEPDKVPEGFPKPKRVSLVSGIDHSGEEAYYIYLVFPDSASEETLEWKNLKPLVHWGRQTIFTATGEKSPVYVYIRLESEFPETTQQMTIDTCPIHQYTELDSDGYTIFHDMSSGGYDKEEFIKLAVRLPEEKAAEWFEEKYGRSPYHVTCECCGQDYAVYKSETPEGADLIIEDPYGL